METNKIKIKIIPQLLEDIENSLNTLKAVIETHENVIDTVLEPAPSRRRKTLWRSCA